MDVASPKLRIAGACERVGRPEVVRRCSAILTGDTGDPDFLLVLGGDAAKRLVAAGIPEEQTYWLRVWAARGLLWAGPGSIDVLRAALVDESWRVREMVCKVAARHVVEDLVEDLVQLEADSVPRVRRAAQRAVLRILSSS